MKPFAFALLLGITVSVVISPSHNAIGAPAVRIVSHIDSANSHSLLGQHITVFVKISSDDALGRADIRVQYAFPALTFLGASAVGEFEQWEYFTWRHQPDTLNPDSGFSVIDLTAVADLDNGDSLHPDPVALTLDDRVIKLLFWTTNDLGQSNNCHIVRISDFECGQFVLRSPTGDTAFVPIGADPGCLVSPGVTVIANVNFADGQVCTDNPPDDRGDISLDGIAYNVGDVVLLNRYFIYGNDVWDPVWDDVQILGTDTNDDGLVATVADLRYLIHIIARGSIYSFTY